MTSIKDFHILHFNDVYNIEECQNKELCGGAARFKAALDTQRNRSPESTFTFFSGDALSPSIISTVTHGAHMIPVLNEFQIDCAVIGNHDFDFGVDNLLDCIEKSNFPWLNSNCYDRLTNGLLCDLPPVFIVERDGLRCGLIGLVEPDWIETLPMVNEDNVYVKDFCIEGRKLAKNLKSHWDCHIVIALTHMRWPNDKLLAERVPEIDLILGGHDHDAGVVETLSSNGESRYVVKSGTDFRQFIRISFSFNFETNQLVQNSIKDQEIHIDRSINPDPVIVELVEKAYKSISEKMNKIIGRVEVEMDGRFKEIRTKETNLGNFLCDVAMTMVDADCCLINSGSIRVDAIIPKGDLTMRTLNLTLPTIDSIVVIELTGSDILDVLENSVSKVPSLEGRFAQVSNIKFSYSKSKPAGSRVDKESVVIDERPIQLTRKYHVAMNGFLASGKDGYDMLVGKRMIVDDEDSTPLITGVMNYFKTIKVVNGFCERTKHKQHLTAVIRRQSVNANIALALRTMLDNNVTSISENTMENIKSYETEIKSVSSNGKNESSWTKLRKVIDERDKKRCIVKPIVERRIKEID